MDCQTIEIVSSLEKAEYQHHRMLAKMETLRHLMLSTVEDVKNLEERTRIELGAGKATLKAVQKLIQEYDNQRRENQEKLNGMYRERSQMTQHLESRKRGMKEIQLQLEASYARNLELNEERKADVKRIDGLVYQFGKLKKEKEDLEEEKIRQEGKIDRLPEELVAVTVRLAAVASPLVLDRDQKRDQALSQLAQYEVEQAEMEEHEWHEEQQQMEGIQEEDLEIQESDESYSSQEEDGADDEWEDVEN